MQRLLKGSIPQSPSNHQQVYEVNEVVTVLVRVYGFAKDVGESVGMGDLL